MTMKAIELSDEMSISAPHAARIAPDRERGARRVLSRWIHALGSALSRYVAHNERAWDRMAAAQAHDPNRH